MRHTTPRVLSREQLTAKLQRSYPNLFLSTTEEFNGSQGGIWTHSEDLTLDRNDQLIFDYYQESESYTFGVINHLHNFLERNGWYAEWNDPGTLMIWEA